MAKIYCKDKNSDLRAVETTLKHSLQLVSDQVSLKKTLAAEGIMAVGACMAVVK